MGGEVVLYPYQEKAVDEIRNSFRQGIRNVLLCSPTGSGKTVMFSHIVSSAVKKETKVLILTDRIELLSGTGGTLEKFGVFPEYLHEKNEVNWDKFCVLGMAQTLERRKNLFDLVKQRDLVILDEVHKQIFDKFFEMGLFYDSYVIGCTATPKRQGKQKELSEMYGKIVYTKSVSELVDEGYLVKADTYAAPGLDFSGCKTSKKFGEQEFVESDVLKVMDQGNVYTGIANNWKRICPDSVTVVFCVNIEHSIKTAEHLNLNGISARYITSEMSSKERKSTLQDWYDGKFKCLCNCGIFTTGFDFPAISCVVLNRATKSENLFLQMCGRGSRVFPGKSKFDVLDFGGNAERHGLWAQDRIYSLLHKKQSVEGEGVAGVKECGRDGGKKVLGVGNKEGCGALIPIKSRVCPYCGFEYIQESIVIGDEVVELEKVSYKEVVSGVVSLADLERYRESKGYKMGWIVIQIALRGEWSKEIREYQKMKGYHWAWCRRQEGLRDKVLSGRK